MLISLLIIFLLFLCCTTYALLIISFTYGWYSLESTSINTNPPSTKICVILPFRDEEDTIIACLRDLMLQDYDKTLYEIILVDDCSSDRSVKKIQDFITSFSSSIAVRLLHISSSKAISSKKQAIAFAIEKTTAELIITTDADCNMSPRWISSIVSFYEEFKPSLIVAPVFYQSSNNLFSQMQSLEFLSLTASTAAATNIKQPIMCNGANLAYTKKAFIESGGFENNQKFASGDDVFLLHNIKKQRKENSILYLKHLDAVVRTQASKTLWSFLNQRIRWASKTKGYTDSFSLFVASTIFALNAFILLGLLLSFFHSQLLLPTLYVFFTKCLIDLPLIVGACQFARQNRLLWLYLPLQAIYPLYITSVAILALFGRYQWKGRVISY